MVIPVHNRQVAGYYYGRIDMAENNNISTNESRQVMIVDDVEVNRFVLSNIMKSMGYTPITAENGINALEVLKGCHPELILLDISMPEMDGYEFATIVKADIATRDIPIIFISAYDEINDMVKGFGIGGEDYITKPFIPEVVKARTGVHLNFYETKRELQETNRRLQASLSNQLKQIEQEKKGVLYALANLARSNSLYSEEYINKLQYNCRLLAQALQIAGVCEEEITDNFIDTIEIAAPLCDIGNVAVPIEILQKKNEPLTDHEKAVMRTHTTSGSRILRDIALSRDYSDFVEMAADIALSHHENWDGTGYPNGKAGNEIPLSAQIVSIISVYSALTSPRAYRGAYTSEEASRMMASCSGTQFNPKILEISNKIIRQYK